MIFQAIIRPKSVEAKLFLLLSISLLPAGLLFLTFHHFAALHSFKVEFISRYSSILDLTSTSVIQLERAADEKMTVALKSILEKQGIALASTASMRRLSSDLGMTHIFEADNNGNYVMSTNEDPKLIPNIFSFCNKYRDMIRRGGLAEITPIIPPVPEIKPYKFAIAYNPKVKRFASVGLRVDFLQQALKNLISSDENIQNVNIYSPKGVNLGSFHRGEFQYIRTINKSVPVLKSGHTESADNYRFLKWVDSPHPSCCQCMTSGDMRDGHHQYLLELTISTMPLILVEHQEQQALIVYSIIWIIISLFISRIASRLFTKKIKQLSEAVSSGLYGGTGIKVHIAGDDEVSKLSLLFQKLIDRIEENNKNKILEQVRAKQVELSQQVAHDIRSPLTALDFALSKTNLPPDVLPIIKSSIERIKKITNKLSTSLLQLSCRTQDASIRLVNVSLLTEQSVHEKKLEIKASNPAISIQLHKNSPSLFCFLDPTEFRILMSNLLNNAVESIKAPDGQVDVYLQSDRNGEMNAVRLLIKDNGVGVPDAVLQNLGKRGFTYGKAGGSGLGLYHAFKFVQDCNGDFKIYNSGGGTVVEIRLPQVEDTGKTIEKIQLYNASPIIVLDDDPLMHQVWNSKFKDADIPFSRIHLFQDPDTFIKYYRTHFHDLENAIFIFDYDFGQKGLNGLELIRELGIANQSILVTGRAAEDSIKSACSGMKIRLVPKSQISNLDIVS